MIAFVYLLFCSLVNLAVVAGAAPAEKNVLKSGRCVAS